MTFTFVAYFYVMFSIPSRLHKFRVVFNLFCYNSVTLEVAIHIFLESSNTKSWVNVGKILKCLLTDYKARVPIIWIKPKLNSFFIHKIFYKVILTPVIHPDPLIVIPINKILNTYSLHFQNGYQFKCERVRKLSAKI